MLHDFLFERDHAAWVYDKARYLFNPRDVEEWIMHFQTGRTAAPEMEHATSEERRSAGNGTLRKLSEDLLNLYFGDSCDTYTARGGKAIIHLLLQRLHLDGYTYRFPRLAAPEADILNTCEQAGVLEELYSHLDLAEPAVASHCLKLSAEHWLNGKWDDCIANSRRFLEAALREVAAAHHLKEKNAILPPKTHVSPELVRQYLRAEGLLEPKEEEAVRVVYGLLSNVGNHPYIAQMEQARLLRQQALIYAQFILLRYQGFLVTRA